MRQNTRPVPFRVAPVRVRASHLLFLQTHKRSCCPPVWWLVLFFTSTSLAARKRNPKTQNGNKHNTITLTTLITLFVVQVHCAEARAMSRLHTYALLLCVSCVRSYAAWMVSDGHDAQETLGTEIAKLAFAARVPSPKVCCFCLFVWC